MRLHQLIVEDTLEFPTFAENNGEIPGSAWSHNPIVRGSHACETQTMIQVINPPPRRMGSSTTIRTSNGDTAATPTTTERTIVDNDDDGMTNTILGFKTIRLQTNSNLTAAV
jgi:hypothetical protein